METIMLPESVKGLSEMYALGSISLSQVAEEVEKLPLCEQTSVMISAMKYAEDYYEEYAAWEAHMQMHGGADLI